MTTALAVNRRTAIKATIKRESARARARMNRLDRNSLQELDKIYRRAALDLQNTILQYADDAGNLRLSVMRDLLGQVHSRLDQLSLARNALLDNGLINAAELGVSAYAIEPALAASLTRVSHEAVQFVHQFVDGGGLQLSDRLWRLDNGAREGVGQAIESAIIQGHSASQAASEFVARGQDLPADIVSKMNAGNAAGVSKSTAAALLKADGNPRANALRVFRTEMNRAHGEAYMAGGEAHPDFGGWKFLLSPRHPETDICDMHARANLHGLGPGVYPNRKRCPWPAHPNTLSYTEIVFSDEITDEDRAGKVDPLEWLKGQPVNVQDGVLNSRRKRVALQRGILKKNEITTPWATLKKVYEKRGIDITDLKPPPLPITKLKPPLLTGNISDETRRYTVDAFAHAPDEAHGLISNTPTLSALKIKDRGRSYYQGGNIVLSKTSMQTSAWRHSKYTVYRHEFGHHIDFSALTLAGNKYPAQISYTSDKFGGLRNTMERAKKSLHARSAAQKQRFKGLKAKVADMDGSIQDLFGCLTKNRMGGGHSNSYLQRPGSAETEVFAQLFELYCRQDQSGWKFVAAELPDLTDNFKALALRMGKV